MPSDSGGVACNTNSFGKLFPVGEAGSSAAVAYDRCAAFWEQCGLSGEVTGKRGDIAASSDCSRQNYCSNCTGYYAELCRGCHLSGCELETTETECLQKLKAAAYRCPSTMCASTQGSARIGPYSTSICG